MDHQCAATVRKTGKRCQKPAVLGATVCASHGAGAPHVKVRAMVRAEVESWGLGAATVDPGEVLLRLVSQSAARAEHYARLLGEAYDAAERLRCAHEDGTSGVSVAGDDAAAAVAREDLDRVFTTGGVAALVGKTYAATKDGDVYATGEAIRGLAQLEAAERERCALFAAKAVAAGLQERIVRVAEHQASIAERALMAALVDIGLGEEQRQAAASRVAYHLRVLA